jgi:hypothetical protein
MLVLHLNMAVLLTAAFLVMIFCQETKKKSLEEINRAQPSN